MILFSIITSTFLISLGALAGAVTLLFKRTWLQRAILILVSLSAGTLLGGAFLHLLPETLEVLEVETTFLLALASFIGFFLLEKVLHWHHCHDTEHEHHVVGELNLIGDAVHNFLDGLILAAAFTVDIQLGIVTAIAIAFHEVPQEIGDFGVLLHSGWKVNKALVANFLVALTIVLGGVVGYFLAEQAEVISYYLMPIAAGGFIYIAASDLLPQIRQEKKLFSSLAHMTIFIFGVAIMYFLAHSE